MILSVILIEVWESQHGIGYREIPCCAVQYLAERIIAKALVEWHWFVGNKFATNVQSQKFTASLSIPNLRSFDFVCPESRPNSAQDDIIGGFLCPPTQAKGGLEWGTLHDSISPRHG